MAIMTRGNSQPPQPPQPAHHDRTQQAQRPRELHPAAAEAVARYNQVWEENDRLAAESAKLTGENEILRRVDAEKTALISDLRRTVEETQRGSDERLAKAENHFRQRLAESERAKERYLRYAVSISERLKACGDQIAAAHETAMEMASGTSPAEGIEREIAALIAAGQKQEMQDKAN
jgi:hypothetical protein